MLPLPSTNKHLGLLYTAEDVQKRSARRVVGIIRGYHIYPEEILDVYQDIITALLSYQKVRPKGFTWPFIVAMVRWTCLAHIKKQRYGERKMIVDIERPDIQNSLVDQSIRARPEAVCGLEMFLERALREGLVRTGNKRAFMDYVWTLYHLFGYTYREIARYVGLSFRDVARYCNRHVAM